MIENKPIFLISDKCCDYSKKKTSKSYVLRNNVDLCITGVRKAEGGVRATAYKTCYYEQSSMDEWTSLFMPLFWYKKEDIDRYISYFDVKNSDCYSVYGFSRTGCACCPFAGKRVFEELEATKKYEPKLYKAVNNVFGKSYDYMEKYYDYRTCNVKKY